MNVNLIILIIYKIEYVLALVNIKSQIFIYNFKSNKINLIYILKEKNNILKCY